MGVFGMALRYLRSRKIALVAVMSIMVGVLAMIVVLSLMDGVQRFIQDHLKGTEGDVIVGVRESDIKVQRHWQFVRNVLARELVAEGGVLAGMAPRFETALLVLPGKEIKLEAQENKQTPIVVGIDWKEELALTPFPSLFDAVKDEGRRVKRESFDDALKPESGFPMILLGDDLAADLRVGAGEFVNLLWADLSSLDFDNPDAKVDSSSQTFQVAGCFSTGRSDYDQGRAYVARSDLLKLIYQERIPGRDAMSVQLRFKPGVDEEVEIKRLRRAYPELSFVSTRIKILSQYHAINDQKRIMIVILSFIIAVAAVAILGIVYMMVVEKTRDIGILRSMGLSRTRMVTVFALYGLMLGIIGCALGVFLGLQVTHHLDEIVGWLSDRFGIKILDPKIYQFKSIPVHIEKGTIFYVVGVAISMSFLAALLPALKAGIMTPVRCLRAE